MRDEHYSQVFFGIIAIIILFFVPLMIVGYNRRLSAETNANVIIEEFVDNCRATAYFTENDYDRLMTQLENLGCRWDVDIWHYSTVYVPNGTGKYVTYEEVYTKDDITSVLFPVGDTSTDVKRYNMRYGDKIEIRAVSKSNFVGLNLASLFVPALKVPIIVDNGEMIDNNID